MPRLSRGITSGMRSLRAASATGMSMSMYPSAFRGGRGLQKAKFSYGVNHMLKNTPMGILNDGGREYLRQNSSRMSPRSQKIMQEAFLARSAKGSARAMGGKLSTGYKSARSFSPKAFGATMAQMSMYPSGFKTSRPAQTAKWAYGLNKMQGTSSNSILREASREYGLQNGARLSDPRILKTLNKIGSIDTSLSGMGTRIQRGINAASRTRGTANSGRFSNPLMTKTDNGYTASTALKVGAGVGALGLVGAGWAMASGSRLHDDRA